jgi:hypothetical protein
LRTEKRRKHAATGSRNLWLRKCCGIGTGIASDQKWRRGYMSVLDLPTQPMKKAPFEKGSGEEQTNKD